MEKIDSYEAVKYHWLTWKILGIHPTKRFKVLYWTYSIVLNFSITFLYPLTLMIDLFQQRQISTLMENVAINLSDFACSLKLFNIFLKLNQLASIKEHMAKLDARVRSAEEIDIMKKVISVSHKIFLFYLGLDAATVISGGVPALLIGGRTLIYPAWFPYDPKATFESWLGTYLYQFIGVGIQAVQQVPQDTALPVYLYVLNGHLECIRIRLSRLGHNPNSSQEENYQELVACIKDYTTTLDYVDLLQSSISLALFSQFLITGAVQCVIGGYLIFADVDSSKFLYLGVYFSAVTAEVALACYFGSEYTQKSNEMTNYIFSSNWMDQSPKFKKAVIIFMQRTQKQSLVRAANWIPASLPTFMSIIRTAYSLFAVLRTMKE